MKQKQQINTEQLGFHERLQREMSSYPVRTVHEDSAVTIQHVKDPYFLVQDSWNVGFLETIPQFLEMVENYKGTTSECAFSNRQAQRSIWKSSIYGIKSYFEMNGC